MIHGEISDQLHSRYRTLKGVIQPYNNDGLSLGGGRVFKQVVRRENKAKNKELDIV